VRRQAQAALPVLMLALLLSGCAGRTPLVDQPGMAGPASAVELTDAPFFPQLEYQCGPAALATVLSYSGAPVQPAELVPIVQLPARRGSLQTELVAAARRYGRVPYQLPPRPAALLAELEARRPVLVLQNLGLRSLPVWHYAVVVGYDPQRRVLVLRSGTEPRLELSLHDFLATWRRADHWGLVLLQPGELPASDDLNGLVRAAAGLEAVGQPAAARQSYRAALRRWPDAANAWFGEANASYALGEPAAAEQAYRRVLALAPEHAAAYNNLAQLLAERGCRAAARTTLRAGLALPALTPQLRAHLQRTWDELQALPPAAEPPRDCEPAAPS
jgi:tetratricopeptide (TPR) repeat protein